MTESKPRSTAFDALTAALAPALIIGMIGSLVFFLVIAFYRGDYDSRLMYILGLYTVATVLIARIAIENGRAHAAMFAAPLALVAVLAMFRFVTISGDLAGLSWLVNIGLLVLSWYLADRITYDCTLLEEDRESLQGGLLQTLGEAATTAKVTEARKSTTQIDLKKARHNPGIWILYFALIAFPLFALGQLIIPDERQRWLAFGLLVSYLGCALALLMTTSLLGLRRYLRQRGTSMAGDMTARWLITGGAIIVAVLIVALLLPLPGKSVRVAGIPIQFKSPDGLQTSKLGWGEDGEQEDSTSAAQVSDSKSQDPQANDNSPPSKNKSTQPSSQTDPQSNSKQSTASKQSSSKPASQQQPSEQSDKQQSSADKSSSDQSSGDKQSQQPDNQDAGGQAQADEHSSDNENGQNEKSQNEKGQNEKGGEQRGGVKQPPGSQPSNNNKQQKSKQPNDQKPPDDQPQANDQQAGQKPQEQSQPAGEAQSEKPMRSGDSLSSASKNFASSLSQMLSGVGDWFKWLLVIVLTAIVVIYALTHPAEIARLWRDLMNLINMLLGRTTRTASDQTKAEPAQPARPALVPFLSLANPFRQNLKGWSAPRVVEHSFVALEAWAAEHGVARKPEQTADEFARMLVARVPRLENLPLQAASMLDRLMFASWKPTSSDLRPLEELWRALERQAQESSRREI